MKFDASKKYKINKMRQKRILESYNCIWVNYMIDDKKYLTVGKFIMNDKYYLLGEDFDTGELKVCRITYQQGIVCVEMNASWLLNNSKKLNEIMGPAFSYQWKLGLIHITGGKIIEVFEE